MDLSISKLDGLRLTVERPQFLLFAVKAESLFLDHLEGRDRQQRFIETNTPEEPAQLDMIQQPVEGPSVAAQKFKNLCRGARQNLVLTLCEAVDLVTSIANGLQAIAFKATTDAMLHAHEQARVHLTPRQLKKIQKDRQALIRPHLAAVMPMCLAAYE